MLSVLQGCVQRTTLRITRTALAPWRSYLTPSRNSSMCWRRRRTHTCGGRPTPTPPTSTCSTSSPGGQTSTCPLTWVSAVGSYTLEKSSSEAQQTRPFGVIINGVMQKLSLEHGTAKKIWKINFKQICFEVFFRKVAIVSEDLIVIGS